MCVVNLKTENFYSVFGKRF